MSVVIGLSIGNGRLLSQETPLDDGPAPPPAESILRESQAAHFRLVLGRIEMDSVRYRKGTINRNTGPTANPAATSETLTIDATRGMPRLHFTRHSRHQRATLDINERGRLAIESEIGDERVSLVQAPHRPIVVQYGVGQESMTWVADTWIHFYVSHPATYTKHFQPLVDDLIRGTPLHQLVDTAHARSLTELADAAVTSDAVLWHSIERLGASQRTTRIEAQRELHQCGISLLPRLRQIDPQRLDAEQRDRLRQVIQQLTPSGEDCESRIAAMIRDDSAYWLAAESRLSGPERILVSNRLSGLALSPDTRLARTGKTPPVQIAATITEDDRRR